MSEAPLHSTNADEYICAQLLKTFSDMHPSTDEKHAFIEEIRQLLNSAFMSSQASREMFIFIFPPENLVHPICLKMIVLYRNMRDVLSQLELLVEQC